MTNLLDIPVKRADGSAATLAEHAGKVTLIVNVASKCGLTKQYEGLEKLFEDKRDQASPSPPSPATTSRARSRAPMPRSSSSAS